ncbi:MAG: hypothetical protein A2Z95_08060 [Gallionellales bacterium GWA2_60_18]|nr:MAG: hypothetical protein A2Z95_08060 [Gallionellales bacterium GWA2_60_18]
MRFDVNDALRKHDTRRKQGRWNWCRFCGLFLIKFQDDWQIPFDYCRDRIGCLASTFLDSLAMKLRPKTLCLINQVKRLSLQFFFEQVEEFFLILFPPETVFGMADFKAL